MGLRTSQSTPSSSSDSRSQILSVVNANHKRFLQAASLVSQANSSATRAKAKTLRAEWSEGNEAVKGLRRRGGGDRWEREVREEVGRWRAEKERQAAQQQQLQPGAPAFGTGGFGVATPVPQPAAGGFGGFGATPALAAPKTGGFGGLGAPGSSLLLP